MTDCGILAADGDIEITANERGWTIHVGPRFLRIKPWEAVNIANVLVNAIETTNRKNK